MLEREFSSEMIILITTEKNLESAQYLARVLLEKKVVVCISMSNINSHYWWEGQIEKVNEIQMLIKTTPNKKEDMLRTIEESHSYEVPELVIMNTLVSDQYMQWADKSMA